MFSFSLSFYIPAPPTRENLPRFLLSSRRSRARIQARTGNTNTTEKPHERVAFRCGFLVTTQLHVRYYSCIASVSSLSSVLNYSQIRVTCLNPGKPSQRHDIKICEPILKQVLVSIVHQMCMLVCGTQLKCGRTWDNKCDAWCVAVQHSLLTREKCPILSCLLSLDNSSRDAFWRSSAAPYAPVPTPLMYLN